MKKLLLKLLNYCLGKFQDEVLNNINNTTAELATKLMFERTKLVTSALLDSDPNDGEQLKDILKQTLVSESFVALEQNGISLLVETIKDENLAKIVLGTERFRMDIFKLLADEDPNNKAQLEDLVTDFTQSDEFVEYVSLLAQHLITKKLTKNGRNSK